MSQLIVLPYSKQHDVIVTSLCYCFVNRPICVDGRATWRQVVLGCRHACYCYVILSCKFLFSC